MISLHVLLTIIICGISNMLVGFLWYSPVLFGNPWARMMGIKEMSSEMKKGLAKIYALSFLSAMVTALFLMFFVGSISGGTSYFTGLIAAFFIWMGFVSTTQFTNWLFSKKPFQLFLIDTGYQLVGYLVMSIVIMTSLQFLK